VVLTGRSRKGPWRLSRTLATHTGMTNEWLRQQGLLSLKELWVKMDDTVRNRRLRTRTHGLCRHSLDDGVWCGEGELVTPPYPIERFHSFPEQVAVCSRSLKPERCLICRINEHPIRFNVAITRRLPVPYQSMVTMFGMERLASCKLFHNLSELREVFTAFPHPLDIPRELCGL
jgi:hypothetical protein